MSKLRCTARVKALHERRCSCRTKQDSSNAYLTRTRANRKSLPESSCESLDCDQPKKKCKHHKGHKNSPDVESETQIMTSTKSNSTRKKNSKSHNEPIDENRLEKTDNTNESDQSESLKEKPPDLPEKSVIVDVELVKHEYPFDNTTIPDFVDYSSIPGQSQAPDPMDVDPLALPAIVSIPEPIINTPEITTTETPSDLPTNDLKTSTDLTSNEPESETGLITNIQNEHIAAVKKQTNLVISIPIDPIKPPDEINPITIRGIIIPNSIPENNCEHSYDEAMYPYEDFHRHKDAYDQFVLKFRSNPYGHTCLSCNRLYFKNDLEAPDPTSKYTCKFIEKWFKHWRVGCSPVREIRFCKSCKKSIDNENYPVFFRFHGFKYPVYARRLPTLDPISERLIAPVLPFLQIRRLHYTPGHNDAIAQVINVPMSADTMVNRLPRDLDDDYCININVKENKAYNSSHLEPLVNNKRIKEWMRYLKKTPLYQIFPIQFNEYLLNDNEDPKRSTIMAQICERMPDDDNLTALQQTLLWSDVKYLQLGHTPMNLPMNMMDYIEELCFPTIYVGQPRMFTGDVPIDPFMVTMSELKRTDRRGVTPDHLIYMAIKLMRLRIRDFLENTCKYFKKNTSITTSDIESNNFITNSFESNLAFLRSIPNSTWYWSERKKDLFAMIRQFGIPTLYLSVTANEIGWNELIQILYKLQQNTGGMWLHNLNDLKIWSKSVLVNNDAVVCAIYFNKMMNVLMEILQSNTPLNDRHVLHYFRTLDFKHTGSPKMHILLWLSAKNSRKPIDLCNEDKAALTDDIISLKQEDSCGFMNLQFHEHTFACFKEIGNPDAPRECKYGAPFMPCPSTVVLEPMSNSTPGFAKYSQRYFKIRENLKISEYPDMATFYEQNGILSDEHYLDVLRAGIDRETVFIKREPHDKWTFPFNPFIMNIVKAPMNIQLITDEHSCASFVVDYVNKTNRGISELKHQLLRLKEEHPEFDINELSRNISIDLLNSVEITAQEAAWYLLQEPMSKSSVDVVYIPTEQPSERIEFKKDAKDVEHPIGLEDVDDDFSDPWNKHDTYGQDWFKMYETRPYEMDGMTLAEFVMRFEFSSTNKFDERRNQCVIRYRNYDINAHFTEYRREMVTLHWPFRNEASDIIEDMKFMCIYHEFEELILQRHKKIEPDLEVVQKINEICNALCNIEGIPDDEADEVNLTSHLRSHLMQNSVRNLVNRNTWTTPPVIDLDTETDTATENSNEKDDGDVELIEDDEVIVEEPNLMEDNSVDSEVTVEESKLMEHDDNEVTVEEQKMIGNDLIDDKVTVEEQKLRENDLIDNEVTIEEGKIVKSDLQNDEMMTEDLIKNDEVVTEERTVNKTI